MSKFVKVKTELREAALVKRSLDDLKIQYKEDHRYVHRWSGFTGAVPVLVEHNRLTFGFRLTDDGMYEVIGDDMQMRKIRDLVTQVQQRYAYHMVVAETEKAGFSLVEENVGRDKVIRMTVRRWT